MSSYFFCGIGGSGMMPLATLLKLRGFDVRGSDRSYDQGNTPDKFEDLKNVGIELVPQDGNGLGNFTRFIVSSAVEERIPDVRTAKEKNLEILTRGQLLAELFNAAQERIAVAGTSGKSTVTGMIGTMLSELEHDPTIINGGGITNFEASSSIRNGDGKFFVAEMDESDGSIAHYLPSVAVLNNVALDHKSMEELEKLFGDYLAVSSKSCVLNADQPRVMALTDCSKVKTITYAIENQDADLLAVDIQEFPFSVTFKVNDVDIRLNVPGRYNVENALAALAAGQALGLDLEACAKALSAFSGIHRRMQLIGTQRGVTVIDDFAHNPDKISASLRSLKQFDGRVIVMFQPHGFGPLRLMGQEMVDVFSEHLDGDDILLMPEAYYAGGTVDRSVTAQHLISDLNARDTQAHWFAKRDEIPEFIQQSAQTGDRIVIMGARDDSLHDFAKSILAQF